MDPEILRSQIEIDDFLCELAKGNKYAFTRPSPPTVEVVAPPVTENRRSWQDVVADEVKSSSVTPPYMRQVEDPEKGLILRARGAETGNLWHTLNSWMRYDYTQSQRMVTYDTASAFMVKPKQSIRPDDPWYNVVKAMASVGIPSHLVRDLAKKFSALMPPHYCNSWPLRAPEMQKIFDSSPGVNPFLNGAEILVSPVAGPALLASHARTTVNIIPHLLGQHCMGWTTTLYNPNGVFSLPYGTPPWAMVPLWESMLVGLDEVGLNFRPNILPNEVLRSFLQAECLLVPRFFGENVATVSTYIVFDPRVAIPGSYVDKFVEQHLRLMAYFPRINRDFDVELYLHTMARFLNHEWEAVPTPLQLDLSEFPTTACDPTFSLPCSAREENWLFGPGCLENLSCLKWFGSKMDKILDYHYFFARWFDFARKVFSARVSGAHAVRINTCIIQGYDRQDKADLWDLRMGQSGFGFMHTHVMPVRSGSVFSVPMVPFETQEWLIVVLEERHFKTPRKSTSHALLATLGLANAPTLVFISRWPFVEDHVWKEILSRYTLVYFAPFGPCKPDMVVAVLVRGVRRKIMSLVDICAYSLVCAGYWQVAIRKAYQTHILRCLFERDTSSLHLPFYGSEVLFRTAEEAFHYDPETRKSLLPEASFIPPDAPSLLGCWANVPLDLAQT